MGSEVPGVAQRLEAVNASEPIANISRSSGLSDEAVAAILATFGSVGDLGLFIAIGICFRRKFCQK